MNVNTQLLNDMSKALTQNNITSPEEIIFDMMKRLTDDQRTTDPIKLNATIYHPSYLKCFTNLGAVQHENVLAAQSFLSQAASLIEASTEEEIAEKERLAELVNSPNAFMRESVTALYDALDRCGVITIEDKLQDVLFEHLRAISKGKTNVKYATEPDISFTLGSDKITLKCGNISNLKRHLMKSSTMHELVALLLFDLFTSNEIELPNGIESLSELTERLYPGERKDVYLTDDDTYETITECNRGSSPRSAESERKILYFLFGLKDDDIKTTTKNKKNSKEKSYRYVKNRDKKLAGWGLDQSETTNTAKLADKAESILANAIDHPMINYLTSNVNIVRYADYTREILQRMYRSNKHDPMLTVIEWLKDELSVATKESPDYTLYDLLLTAGAVADTIHELNAPNYALSINEAVKACEKLQIFGCDTEHSNKCCDFLKSTSIFRDTKNTYEFKLKPFRLVCAAFFLAEKVNLSSAAQKEIIQTLTQAIESYFPAHEGGTVDSTSKKEVSKKNRDFHDQHDTYCFFTISLLYFLSPKLRNLLITAISQKCNDFKRSSRDLQISYLFLASAVLASDIYMTSSKRLALFEQTYAKTMYKFQSMYWRKISGIFREHVKNTVRDACTLKSGVTASSDPYYLFVFGLINEDDASPDVYNGDTHIVFLRKCASLQCQSWHPYKKEGVVSDLCRSINQQLLKAKSILEDNIGNIAECIKDGKPLTSGNIDSSLLYYVYGVQLLGYTASNVINYKSEKDTANNCSKTSIYSDGNNDKSVYPNDWKNYPYVSELIFYSDFIMRLANEKYNKYVYSKDTESKEDFSSLCLPCGSYRYACATTTPTDKKVSSKTKGVSAVFDKYVDYLNAEARHEGARRYLYLMASMLYKLTTFFDEKERLKKLEKNVLERLKSCVPDDFLDYDGFSVENKNKAITTPIRDSIVEILKKIPLTTPTDK